MYLILVSSASSALDACPREVRGKEVFQASCDVSLASVSACCCRFFFLQPDSRAAVRERLSGPAGDGNGCEQSAIPGQSWTEARFGLRFALPQVINIIAEAPDVQSLDSAGAAESMAPETAATAPTARPSQLLG